MIQEKTKCIFKPLIMAKIEYMCALRPDKEWSGNVFYRVRNDEEGNTIITCEDLAIMDHLGSSGFTEFDFTDDYAANYISRHRNCLGCYMGLLHSHHSMNIGPSAQDDETIKKEGMAKDTNNFLSIIVYNDKNITPYSIRITQRTTTEVIPGEKKTLLFGKYVIESKSSLTFKPVEDLEIIDILQREYYEPFWTDAQREEFEARIKELEDKRKKKEEEEAKKREEAKTGSYYGGNSFYGYWSSKKDDKDDKPNVHNGSVVLKTKVWEPKELTAIKAAFMVANLSMVVGQPDIRLIEKSLKMLDNKAKDYFSPGTFRTYATRRIEEINDYVEEQFDEKTYDLYNQYMKSCQFMEKVGRIVKANTPKNHGPYCDILLDVLDKQIQTNKGYSLAWGSYYDYDDENQLNNTYE